MNAQFIVTDMSTNDFDSCVAEYAFYYWLDNRVSQEHKKINERIRKFRKKQDFFIMRERNISVLRNFQYLDR